MSGKEELHHSAHAAHARSAHRHFWFIFFLFHDHTFCSQEHTCDRSCIFKSHTSYFSRIYYTGSVQIFVNIRTSIVTEVTFTFTYFLNNYRTFLACIGNNFAKRLFDSTFDDTDTCCFVRIVTLHAFKRIDSTDVSNATTRDDTFFDSSASCTQCIVYTVFLFFHFYFRSSTYIDR